MKNPTYVLYHGACPDGFGAAWAAWRALKSSAQYIPCFFSKPMPVLPADAKVLMVDFSYPRPKMMELASKVKEIMILDHHKTAADALGDLPWAKFDMNHSGAYLSWVHFHGTPVPEFVLYLEDRDLWRFKLPHSAEVAATLTSYPMDFVVWEKLSLTGMDKMKLVGGDLLRMEGQLVTDMVSRAYWKEIGGHRVPVANASVMFSQVGDRLCQLHPEAPFAAYYYDRNDGKRIWGLRSPGRFDVSVVAKSLGGGGHPGAAGFEEDL